MRRNKAIIVVNRGLGRARVSLAFLCCILILTMAPKRALACEVAPMVAVGQSISIALQEAVFTALGSVVQGFIASKTGPFGKALLDQINVADDTARQDYSDLWDAWLPGLKDMTEQLNVSYIDRTRQQGSMLDSQVQSIAQRGIEKRELEAFRELTPSDQMCVVDTVNPYLLKAEETTRAVSVAMENELYAGGTGTGAMNMAGTPSANGPDAALNADFDIIMNNYKDPNYNGGEMPAGPASARAGDQLNPAKIIFGKETIDLNDANNRQDLKVYTRLALGSPVLEPVREQATKTVAGRDMILKRQRYQARVNNYAGALIDPVSSRASVTAAPEVETMRMSNGVLAGNISAAPSYREISGGLRRKMWTPLYMKDLNESPHTAEQKQVDLYSQKITDLQDMTRNMERIGMIFSSRLGQRLDGLGASGDGVKNDVRR